MFSGYMGRLLFVDLTEGAFEVEEPPRSLYEKFLGGYGLGAKILLERQPGGVDALGEENLLGFTTGPLIGSRATNASRFTIVGKSPLTNAWGDSSCGGRFAPALKGSGYDAVFFTGISPRPVYVHLSPGKAEIHGADDLWGQNTLETERVLKERHGRDAMILSIGIAGENCNLIAGIVHEEGRLAARCGLGAVMGSKRLKALVVHGGSSVTITDKEAEASVWEKYTQLLRDNLMVDAFRGYGTTGGLKFQIQMGDTPIKNWKGTAKKDFPWADQFDGERIAALEVKKYACHKCALVCGAWLPFSNGEFPGLTRTRKPEYETFASFGPLLLIHDVDTIVKANVFCNLAGMDTINAGATIAMAMECFEKGILTLEDTEGLDLTWGNQEFLLPLLEKMARREGFGALLSDGLDRAARRIGNGAESFAMGIMGEAVPMHDPRFRPGWATSYQTDATPAHHEQGGAHFGEGAWGLQGIETPKFDKYNYSGKAKFQRQVSTLIHVVNAAGLCKFIIHALPVSFLWEYLNAITGSNHNLEDLMILGERISVIRQIFNVREGKKLSGIRMPDRLRGSPPLMNGPLEGISIDDELQIDEYLQEMSWDRDGRPHPDRLAKLGLGDLIPIVWPQ